MIAKDIFILHGEKIALGIAGVICGVVLYTTFVNEDIRPSAAGSTAKDITESIAAISEYRKRAHTPLLKPVPEYAQRMKDDFAHVVSARPALAWTTVHPDMGPVTPPDTYLYVYELGAPRLEVKDAIGSLEIIVALPAAVRGGERLSDLAAVEWTRKDAGVVTNTAGIAGAVLEQRTGKDPKAEWQPVQGGRLIPVADLAKPIVIEGTVDFETYAFRARLIATATGFRPGSEVRGDVLIAEGRILAAEATPDEEWWRKLESRIFGHVVDFSGFLNPSPPPEGVVLAERESAYRGPLSEPATLVASSAIRFQLDKLAPDPEKPDGQLATVLLTKLLREQGKEAWLPMQKFALAPGAQLGKEKPIKSPIAGGVQMYDLTTPFTLEKLEKDVKRTIYYEVKTVERKDGKPGKALDVFSKDSSTDVATLLNGRTGDHLVLVKLGRLTRPGDPKARITPDLVPADEQELFTKDPGGFRQQALTPEPPVRHGPGTGPLEELRKKGDVQATTDTDYFEMPDGRLYFWSPLNRDVLMRLRPGAILKAHEVAPAPAAVPAPAAAPAGAGTKPAGSTPAVAPKPVPPKAVPPPPPAPRSPTPAAPRSPTHY